MKNNRSFLVTFIVLLLVANTLLSIEMLDSGGFEGLGMAVIFNPAMNGFFLITGLLLNWSIARHNKVPAENGFTIFTLPFVAAATVIMLELIFGKGGC